MEERVESNNKVSSGNGVDEYGSHNHTINAMSPHEQRKGRINAFYYAAEYITLSIPPFFFSTKIPLADFPHLDCFSLV